MQRARGTRANPDGAVPSRIDLESVGINHDAAARDRQVMAGSRIGGRKPHAVGAFGCLLHEHRDIAIFDDQVGRAGLHVDAIPSSADQGSADRHLLGRPVDGQVEAAGEHRVLHGQVIAVYAAVQINRILELPIAIERAVADGHAAINVLQRQTGCAAIRLEVDILDPGSGIR